MCCRSIALLGDGGVGGVGRLMVMADLGMVQLVADRLMALYPREESLRRVLALAHVDTSRIPFDSIAANVSWWAAVQAKHQGRLLRVVEVMMEEYPVDPWVMALHIKMTRKADSV